MEVLQRFSFFFRVCNDDDVEVIDLNVQHLHFHSPLFFYHWSSASFEQKSSKEHLSLRYGLCCSSVLMMDLFDCWLQNEIAFHSNFTYTQCKVQRYMQMLDARLFSECLIFDFPVLSVVCIWGFLNKEELVIKPSSLWIVDLFSFCCYSTQLLIIYYFWSVAWSHGSYGLISLINPRSSLKCVKLRTNSPTAIGSQMMWMKLIVGICN